MWAAAGFVALVAGLLWGARSGVQFALMLVALKALPVLIIGGFTSVPGAIVGGLIVGASKSSPRSIIGPFVGGGIEGWFPYVLAVCSCWCGPKACSAKNHPARLTSGNSRIPSCSTAKPANSSTSYAQDSADPAAAPGPHRHRRHADRRGRAAARRQRYWLSAILIPWLSCRWRRSARTS